MTAEATAAEPAACDAAAVASLLGALASPCRIQIVRLLADEGELDVTELALRLGQSVANVSAHLKRLRHAGLVTSHRAGSHIENRLTHNGVVALCAHACDVLPAHRYP